MRWALDLKGVRATRKAPPPGAHMAVALWLTRGLGQDVPAARARRPGDRRLDRDHRRPRGSAIPEPPLYPADPAELDRALAIEDYFDEELGPYARLLAFHELAARRAASRQFTAGDPAGAAGRATTGS